MAKGWSGRGYPAPRIGATGPEAESPAGWLVGEAQCAAPQADSVVMVLDTTANGCCGSRGSSRVGNKVDKGATAFSGESKMGRFLGAQAANCAYGGATFKGAASGSRKSDGRSIGAYSGPSSQVAMPFIVDAAGLDAVSAESPATPFA
jgi:hypothetical protein